MRVFVAISAHIPWQKHLQRNKKKTYYCSLTSVWSSVVREVGDRTAEGLQIRTYTRAR